MKTAVIYISRHGTTEKVAKEIEAGLKSEVHLINYKKQRRIDLDSYDTIIIGASIHAGKMNKRMKSFCEKNIIKLLNKQLALFLCCMDKGEEAQKLFENAFPEVLREHSKCSQLAGGEFLLEEMNFIEKAIIKKLTGNEESCSQLNYENINQLSMCINALEKKTASALQEN